MAQKPYVFDGFKFSLFFPVEFGCSFLDNALLFCFYQKQMAFWPQTSSFPFEWDLINIFCIIYKIQSIKIFAKKQVTQLSSKEKKYTSVRKDNSTLEKWFIHELVFWKKWSIFWELMLPLRHMWNEWVTTCGFLLFPYFQLVYFTKSNFTLEKSKICHLITTKKTSKNTEIEL